jgi:transcriptional regulator with XRE-family HTH domain
VTPLAALLARIGWTTGELAARLDISPDTTRSWANGRRSTPLSVLAWLADVAAAVTKVRPKPAGWEGVRPGHRESNV